VSSCSSEASPDFQPALRIISSITNANPASVTTTIDHDYLDGLIVRLIIPDGFGMTQADNLTGTITVTADDTFTIDIDTTNFDAFAAPSPLPSAYTCAQVIPIAEGTSLTNVTKNLLPSGER
jgi:hypothetical protein